MEGVSTRLEHILTADTSEVLFMERTLREVATRCGREDIARNGISSLLSSILTALNRIKTQEKYDGVRIECLRVLANACIDHNDNREFILSHGVVDILLNDVLMLGYPEAEWVDPTSIVAKTTCGVFVNVCTNYAPGKCLIREKACLWRWIASMLDPNRMLPEYDINVFIALKLVDAVQSEDEPNVWFDDCQELMSAVVQLANHILTDADKEEMMCYRILPAVMESMSKDSVKMQEQLFAGGVLSAVLITISTLTNNDTDSDGEGAISSKNKVDDASTTTDPRVEIAKIPSKIRHLINTVAHMSYAESVVMSLLSEGSIVQHLSSWIDQVVDIRVTEHSARERAMLLTSVLCLGNMACSEQNCISLVETWEMASKVLSILKTQYQDTQVSDPALLFLRNLTLSGAARRAFEGRDIVPVTSRYLASKVSSIQYHAIRVLKNILQNNATFLVEFATLNVQPMNVPALQLLLDDVKGTDHAGVQGEGIRILLLLIRFAFAESPSITGDTEENEKVKKALCLYDLVGALTRLLRTTKFPILKQEAVLGLVLLARSDVHANAVVDELCGSEEFMMVSNTPNPATGDDFQLEKVHSTLEELLRILKEQDASKALPHLRSNVATLLAITFPLLKQREKGLTAANAITESVTYLHETNIPNELTSSLEALHGVIRSCENNQTTSTE